jgi:hypothetical protein
MPEQSTYWVDIVDPAKVVKFTEGPTVRVDCRLTGAADVRKSGDMDEWDVTLTLCRVPGFPAKDARELKTTFRTGIGHRKYPTGMTYLVHRGYVRPGTIAWEENERLKRPVHPTAKSVLYCLASDVSIALDMPRDDAAAMDHLQAEFGHEGKASDLLEQVRALRKIADGLEVFFRGTRLTLEKFAAAQEELDS